MVNTLYVPNMKAVEMRVLAGSYIQPCFPCNCNPTLCVSISRKTQKPATPSTTALTTAKKTGPSRKVQADESFNQTVGGPQSQKKKRVFFLDVNPLCYEGSKPSLHSFARWLSLFFSQVSHTDPVIAVISLSLSECLLYRL